MHKLKERIKSGEAVHGCWINLGSPVSAEIVGNAGFDWVLVDLEHGAGDTAIMYNQLQVLKSSASTHIVRTDDITRPQIQHIMDAGASGIMFPQIKSAGHARESVAMMYYPPRGVRGMAKMVRATDFGKHSADYIANLDQSAVGIIQIERLEALEDIDAIAAEPGVDVLFVGPSDLTVAMGIFGQLDHPRYQEAIRVVAKAAQKHGKCSGVLLLDPAEYEMYYNLGYRFLACGADAAFVKTASDEMVAALHSARQKFAG
jgi:4-hydroxy-2-oxoheptanedioate aldolase